MVIWREQAAYNDAAGNFQWEKQKQTCQRFVLSFVGINVGGLIKKVLTEKHPIPNILPRSLPTTPN